MQRMHYTRREFLLQSGGAGMALASNWPGTRLFGREQSDLLPSATADTWERQFANPTDEYRIGVYWWWFGPAIAKAEVTRELQVMRRAGIGYVLIFPIYPLSPDDPKKGIRNLSYLSPEFLDVIGFATAKAKGLGIDADVLIGTGWPYGGPSITPELSSQRLRVETIPAHPGGLARPPVLTPHEKLEAAWLVKTDGERTDISSARDVTQDLETAGSVSLQPHSGFNTLMVFIQSPVGMTVKRAALGAEGLVMDHLSQKAVHTYLDAVAAKLVGATRGSVRAMHSDSLEVYREEWTPGFLDEFSKRRGYDLKPYLPALISDIGPLTPDVRHDYWKTLSELAFDNYIQVLHTWCHAHGVGVQAEMYGTPPVNIASYSAVDYVMGESYDWKMFTPSRWASSAAHQLGRKAIPAEAYTWLRHPRYVATLQDLKVASDLHFICGINKLVAHGYAYSPPVAGIPGWGYYASVMLNDCNTWWPYFHFLADYVHRVSYALSRGKPVIDVALYLPEDDVMAGQPLGDGLTLNISVESQLRGGNKPVGEFGLGEAYQSETPVIKTILASGFTFDGFDQSILQPDLKTTEGRLEVGDAAYRIVILPHLTGISLPILERLADFCRSGGTLVATCRLPNVAYGVRDREQKSSRAQALIRDMFGGGQLKENSRHPYGKGMAFFAADETEGLRNVLLSLQPDVRLDPPDAELLFAHREEEGRHIYFLCNVSSQHKSWEVLYRDGKGSPQRLDAMTGAIEPVPIFASLDSGTRMTLELEPYGSALILFEGHSKDAPVEATDLPVSGIRFDQSRGRWVASVSKPGNYFVRSRAGTGHFEVSHLSLPITVKGPWSIHKAGEKTKTVLDSLKSWTEIPGYRYYSGQAVYEITVNIPNDVVGEGRALWLDLGEIREIAEVHVNGHLAGICWKRPYRLDLTKSLRAGGNALSIRVTNLLINRVIGQPTPDFSGLPQPLRFPKPDEKDFVREPLPSGLLGPVQITPYVDIDLTAFSAPPPMPP
jgi:hypothetical protein